MPCKCKPIIITPPADSHCEDCLQAVSLEYLCSEGPAPCGDTLVVDLSLYNDNDAVCDCGAVYSLVEYDTNAFSSVVLTVGGELTVTTTDTYVKRERYTIVYKVDCPCNLLSKTGKVIICKEDLCAGVICAENEECDPCDGICKEGGLDLDVTKTGGGGSDSGDGELDLDVTKGSSSSNSGGSLDLDVVN